jgi:hypothetical protein
MIFFIVVMRGGLGARYCERGDFSRTVGRGHDALAASQCEGCGAARVEKHRHRRLSIVTYRLTNPHESQSGSSMTIRLEDIWKIDELTKYKVHFARWNKINEPLEVWVRDKQEFQGWQEFRPAQNAFNRQYIFSLMQFYHETDIWLFGGIYEVMDRRPDRYVVELMKLGSHLIGRLKLRTSYRERASRVNFEKYYGLFEVQEILREPYSGRRFPGYEGINLSYEEFESIFQNDRADWKAALESVSGVYLITDVQSRKRYVGSAYGDDGIWSRWSSYIATGHGGNVELKKVVAVHGLDHCRKHFRFALLENRPRTIEKNFIVQREQFWKRILFTQGEDGFNRN